MNTRRTFFSRIAGAVATIALAPELAFRAKLALPEVEKASLDQVFSMVFQLWNERQSEKTDLHYVWMNDGNLPTVMPYSELQKMRKEANAI